MTEILIIEDKPDRIVAFKKGLAEMNDQFDVEVVNSYKDAKSIASNKRIYGIIDGMSDTFPNELEHTNAYASIKGNCINEDVKYMIVPNEGQNNLQFSIHSIQGYLSEPIKTRPKGGYNLMDATIRNSAKKLEYSEANTIEERGTDATSSGVQKDSGDQKQKGLQVSAQTIRERLYSNIEGANVFDMACGILKGDERKKYATEIALIKEGYEKKNKKTLLDLIAIEGLDKLV